MSNLLLKGAHVVDPVANLDGIADVLIQDGKISCVCPAGEGDCKQDTKGTTVLDLTGKVLMPGFVDMHVHLREPGFEYREDIASGTRAAAHGGFTAVAAMANTKPVIDEGAAVKFVTDKAKEVGVVKVYQMGAITVGLKGKQLAEMNDMHKSGAIAFSDDGMGIQDPQLMRRAMEYAKVFDALIVAHCEDESLVDGGVVHEGIIATRLGVAGQTSLAEALAVHRDIELARLTGVRLHIAHVSAKESVDLIRTAKAAGDVRVSAEVTPHHLVLNENALDKTYNTNMKMNPPLRSTQDQKALIEGLLDGTIDAIATDHAPHAPQEKELEFELANFGTTGLETAVPLMATHLVSTGKLDWATLVDRMAHGPRRVMNLEPVTIAEGSVADITVVDPEKEVTITRDWLVGKGKNSAFLGHTLKGCATEVLVDGKLVLADGECV
ncbi:MAG: dihydroorotase [Coriobacteriia bacterium]|nr:dihydroorotase [Coriobacteriia bacterium]MCL2870719.1 dihydroorotase [Coriobacteriia bacterium]